MAEPGRASAEAPDAPDAPDDVVEFSTEQGPGRLHRRPATNPRACLVLGHGAGNGIESHDLAALADALPAHGISVVRLEQPWRVAGRKVASAPPTLDAALRAGCAALPAGDRGVPLVLGGRSAGAPQCGAVRG